MNSVPTSTVARTAATTMSAARVRNVMLEVGADFTTIAVAGLVEYDKCVGWCTDLIYLLEKEAVTRFQIQFKCVGHSSLALEYAVSADGTVQSSDRAGGIDYFALPTGTRATLFVSLNYQSSQIEAVRTHLRLRGWSFDGQAVAGGGVQDRVYSSDGYGLVRKKIGTWQ